ncbi:MAG: 16S rRNA (guanine(527)-N(7))-methyltransferase RsmG [Planctomycetes bacterium]|nr:16S rRNA (guanine(527)-N(7))-methyltransferase RsmG [Planctomycetota bacterium]
MDPAWSGLQAALDAAGVTLPGGALEGLVALHGLLEAAGARQNLTRITAPAEWVEKHALDALLGLTCLPEGGDPLVDVGSGGGVPGIPLALARPGWRVTLVESERRKAAFLEEACRALGLADRVGVRAARAEALGRDPAARERHGSAVIRAVAAAAPCLELTLPLVRVGGRAVLYRGPTEAAADLEVARRVAPLLGGGLPDLVALTLPSGARRCLLVVPKVAPCPERFPRREGIPTKRPLTG